jgi:hypothetical protein
VSFHCGSWQKMFTKQWHKSVTFLTEFSSKSWSLNDVMYNYELHSLHVNLKCVVKSGRIFYHSISSQRYVHDCRWVKSGGHIHGRPLTKFLGDASPVPSRGYAIGDFNRFIKLPAVDFESLNHVFRTTACKQWRRQGSPQQGGRPPRRGGHTSVTAEPIPLPPWGSGV